MGGGWWDGEGYPDLGRVERRSEPTAAPRHRGTSTHGATSRDAPRAPSISVLGGWLRLGEGSAGSGRPGAASSVSCLRVPLQVSPARSPDSVLLWGSI